MKPTLVFQGPIFTRSGYGDHCRDLMKSLRKMDKYDIKIIPLRWGNTPQNQVDGESEFGRWMLERVITGIEQNLVPQRGFNLLPEPSECDLFFDLESVPYYVYPNDGLEYLFGIYYVENNKPKFEAYWAHNEKEEKQNLIKFFEFTKNHFKKYPKAKIYHYAKYEITALTRLTSKYHVKGKELDHYLNLEKFVDLFQVIKQAIQVSENSYSIKEIEKFYDFKRSGEVKKANVFFQELQNGL